MTPKQEKLIKLIMENYGKSGETKPMGELMVEAGYSEESAKNPKLILESEAIQEELKDILDEIDQKRRLALKHITEDKLKEQTAKDNALTADTLTKISQLLSDKPTDITKFQDIERMRLNLKEWINSKEPNV